MTQTRTNWRTDHGWVGLSPQECRGVFFYGMSGSGSGIEEPTKIISPSSRPPLESPRPGETSFIHYRVSYGKIQEENKARVIIPWSNFRFYLIAVSLLKKTRAQRTSLGKQYTVRSLLETLPLA